MPYSYPDNAISKAAAGRPSGGATLLVEAGTGARFGSPSPTAPIKLSVFRGPEGEESPQGVLLVSGVSGDALTIAGPLGGGDFEALAGDVVACVPVGSDVRELWQALAAIELTPGPKGDDGTDGEDGAPGTVLRSGTGAPSDSLGVDGDYYLDGSTGDLYQRVTGAYVAVANLKGPPGEDGGGSGPILVSGLVKGDGAGNLSAAVPGVDYVSTAGLAAGLATKADDSAVVHKAGDEAVAGAKTFDDLSAERLAILDTVGAVACESDAAGNFHPFVERLLLAKNVDLTVANGLTGGLRVEFPGVLTKVVLQAQTNGSSGGFTLRPTRNGSALATQAVSSSTTTAVAIAAGSLSSTALAAGDVLDVDCTAAGTGVQSVRVHFVGFRRHQ